MTICLSKEGCQNNSISLAEALLMIAIHNNADLDAAQKELIKKGYITACNILNEGVNLTNCRIGIFCNLNSSEIVVKQRVGRILRHKSPIIIIPYFKDTREEELVEKMIEEYNPELIHVVENVNDIKI